MHPEYSVVVPEDGKLAVGIGFPVANHSVRLESLLSRWIDLKRNDGTIEQLFDHWIEGKTAAESKPRWNVLTDVVGWKEADAAPQRITR